MANPDDEIVNPRPGHFKSMLSQEDGIGTGPAAQVDGTARLDGMIFDQTHQLIAWSHIPWGTEIPVEDFVESFHTRSFHTRQSTATQPGIQGVSRWGLGPRKGFFA